MAKSTSVRRARRWTLLGVGSVLGFVLSTAGGYGAFSSFSNATQQVNTEGGMSLASVVLTGDPGGTALTETVVDMQPGDYRERVIDLTVPYDADVTYSVKADLLSDSTPSAIPGVSQVGDALNAIEATNTGLAATDLSDLNAPAGQGGLFVEIYRCTGAGNAYESTNGVIASRTDDREVSCNNTGVPQGAKGNGTGIAGVEPSSGALLSFGGSFAHTCAIAGDRTLWCWGNNAYGQIGDGTTTDRSTPTQVGTDADWQTATAGAGHTCATKITGTLWCWGYNAYGQIGDGSTTDRSTPTQVGTDADWQTVAGGFFHACAIKTTNTLWCWGRNNRGQLGDGTTTQRTTPTQVGTDTNWQTITTGDSHTCATKTNGTLWCWGYNMVLGNGGGPDQLSPIQIGTDTNWAMVSANITHSCATKTTGTLWCWGLNFSGQIGNNSIGFEYFLVQVGVNTDWTGVVAGFQHTCGTRANGTLWCWGNNAASQLGDGTTTDLWIPTQVGTASNWRSVVAGQEYTCGSKLSGTVECWGANVYGQVGDGTTTPRTTPVANLLPVLGASTTPVVVRPAGQTLRLLIRVRFANDGTTNGRQNTLSNESILLTHRFALVERAGGAV